MCRFVVWMSQASGDIGRFLALNPTAELRQGGEALRCGREFPAVLAAPASAPRFRFAINP
jgi:hypothetical protein